MSERPIGLICAIPEELSLLRPELRGATSHRVGGFQFDEGELFGRKVVIAEAGIGKVNAATVTTLLAARFEVGGLLFAGVAGGLDPSLAIGDVVVASRCIQHDCGVMEAGCLTAYQAGHVPFFNPTEAFGYEPRAQALSAARHALNGLRLPKLPKEAGGSERPAHVHFGTIATGDQYVHCEQTRARLFQQFGALAVAMEGAAMAQVAERMQLPWLEVRALSDLAGAESRFDFARFAGAVAQSACTITRRLLPIF